MGVLSRRMVDIVSEEARDMYLIEKGKKQTRVGLKTLMEQAHGE